MKANRPGTFGAGNRAAANRQPNKLTRDLKEGIVDAAIAVGSDGKGKGGLNGYLEMLARKYPKQYTSLLGRVIPLQINASAGAFIGAVNIVSVPVDRYLTADDMKRLQPMDDEPAIVVDGLPQVGPDDEEAA